VLEIARGIAPRIALCVGLAWSGAGYADTAVTPANPALGAPLKNLGIEGVDHRRPVDSSVWPWIAIGQLNQETGGRCTAALIAPQAVLTAAHCLYNEQSGHWALPMEVHFVAGYSKGHYAGHATGIRFTIAPGYDPRHLNDIHQYVRDWAVVELDRPLDVKPIPLSSRDIASMMRAAQAGEMSCAGYARDYAEVLMRHQGCSLLGEMENGRLLAHRCDVTFGVSGAPLLLVENGKAEIIGIQNAVAGSGDAEFAVAVPVWNFAAAVRKLIGAK
jgi:protease YdgD